MHIVLLNLASASLEAANAALAGEGYEITIANASALEEVLALTPAVLITEATPSDLGCGPRFITGGSCNAQTRSPGAISCAVA